MAFSLHFSPPTATTFNTIYKPGFISHQYNTIRAAANWIKDNTYNFKGAAFEPLKATGNKPSTKPNSILCADCDGNGAKKCSQCEGNGVNLVDHFNGEFKAGAKCWICSSVCIHTVGKRRYFVVTATVQDLSVVS
ncbi:hypothetical protein ABFX02_11G047400 [Erythranthe guttata]